MNLLHSLRAISLNPISVGAAAVCGALVSLTPALAVPISGVMPSTASNDVGGPHRPGPINKTASISGGSKVGRGRPMVIPAAPEAADRLVGLKL